MTKKLFNIKNILFSPILIILLLLCSCTEKDGVIGAEDFSLDDVPEIKIQANPSLTPDTLRFYTNEDGQKSMWTELNYVTNGQHIRLEITGKWTAWYGNNAPLYIPKNMKCNMVTIGDSIQDTYSAADNYQDPVTMKPLHPDIAEPCWFERGSGLYLGLFGPMGAILPKTVFHLQTSEKSCKSPYKEVNDDCILLNKNEEIEKTDQWIYTYTTVGDPVWNGPPPPNQKIKLIILDSYYEDNYGYYNIKFLSGVNLAGIDDTSGIVSSIVKIIEDATFGYYDENRNYHKGIVEILYKQLLIDSIFGKLIKMALILAISILGLSIIMGTTKLTQKEILVRILKIGIVLLFTSNDAWQFFNNFVITWFVQGTNFIIALITNIISEIYPIQMGDLTLYSAQSGKSLASNFNFIDHIWRFLFSTTVQNKVLALLLSNIFGFILSLFLYVSILAFMFILVLFAQIYIFYILEVAFVLALAPIFVSLLLFEKTKHIFLTWLQFLIGKTLEIIFMFFFVYLLISLLLSSYIKILSFTIVSKPLFGSTLAQAWTLGLGAIKVWKPLEEVNPIMLLQILVIIGILYIMFTMLSLSSTIAANIASIGSPSSSKLSGLAMGTLGNIFSNIIKPTLSKINKLPQAKFMGISIFGKRKTISGGVKSGLKVGYKKWGGKKGVAITAFKILLTPASFARGVFNFSNHLISKNKKTIDFFKSSTGIKKRRESADKVIELTEKEGRLKGLSGDKLKGYVRKNIISKVQNDKISHYSISKKDEMDFYMNRLNIHEIRPVLENAMSSLDESLYSLKNKAIDEENLTESIKITANIYNKLDKNKQARMSQEELLFELKQRILINEMSKKSGISMEKIENIKHKEFRAAFNALNQETEFLDFSEKVKNMMLEEFKRANDFAEQGRLREYKLKEESIATIKEEAPKEIKYGSAIKKEEPKEKEKEMVIKKKEEEKPELKKKDLENKEEDSKEEEEHKHKKEEERKKEEENKRKEKEATTKAETKAKKAEAKAEAEAKAKAQKIKAMNTQKSEIEEKINKLEKTDPNYQNKLSKLTAELEEVKTKIKQLTQ